MSSEIELEPYRLYLIDAWGHICSVDFVTADGDDEALAKVKAMQLNQDAEIWLLSRRVAIVPAGRDPAAQLHPVQQPSGRHQ